MVARAEIKFLRVSAQKMRQVIGVVKGKPADSALSILSLMQKKGAQLLYKALHSAVSNAKQKGYTSNELVISKLIANQGPGLRRYRAASFGRATMIKRPTSHVVVELDTPEKRK